MAASTKQPRARFDWFEYAGDDHQPDPGPDEYRNPILQGFYPDPSITRVGDDYYLINSTFCWFPGIPVFHSRDLVNWTQIGNAIDRPTQLDFGKLKMWDGVFAPDISWHDGMFYILNTCVGCGGNFVITASDPKGPWSDPVWLPDLKGGIDPALFFDDDGRVWIVNNGPPRERPRYNGHRALWLQQFDARTLKTFGPRRVLVDGGVHPDRDPIWIEGPHILRKDGHFYLVAAEGGTNENHSEVVFRSDRMTGPYVPFAKNPILTQRDLSPSRKDPITSAGHAEFVHTQNGEWWAAFLAVRPYDDDYFNTGRETFLLPVEWRDGWPRITAARQTIPWTHRRPDLPADGPPPAPTSGAFTIRDGFEGSELAPAWMMMRNPRRRWWHLSGEGLELDGRPALLGDFANPSFLARRQQHIHAVATTELRFDPQSDGAEAGIVALQNDHFWYFLAVGREQGEAVVRLRRRAGAEDPAAGDVVKTAPLGIASGQPVQLRIEAHAGSYDFSWSGDAKHWTTLVEGADGTILSSKRAGGFLGAVLGVHTHGPSASEA